MAIEINVEPHFIRSDKGGYSSIAKLSEDLSGIYFEKILLNFPNVSWFDGNLTSPLAGLLYKLEQNNNSFEINGFPSNLRFLLQRNGFYTLFKNLGWKGKGDPYHTVIKLRHFELNEEEKFNDYLDNQINDKNIPEMTAGVYKKLLEGINELFINAFEHSETKHGVFVCGQLLPRGKKLEFTITDMGIGFRENIKSRLHLDYPPVIAINWAMVEEHTTKLGNIPGGLGLKILREFIGHNRGRLQIVSDKGYWEQTTNGKVLLRELNHKFSGTIINIEINTADNKSYALQKEENTEIPF